MHAAMTHGMRGIPTGYNYVSIEDYILDRGIDFASEPLTEDELTLLHDAIDHCQQRFKLKQCYYNAQSIVLGDPSNTLRYFEGIAQGSILPVHHAWVVTPTDKVIDLTWRLKKPRRKGRMRDRILGEFDMKERGYRGVEFSQDAVRNLWLAYGESRSFFDDWEARYPLFKQERFGKPPEPLSLGGEGRT